MKKFMLSFLLIISVQAFAQDCETVAKSCLKEVTVSTALQSFLKAEAGLGKQIFDLNHINQLKVFTATNLVDFFPEFVSAKELLSLGTWANNKLAVYDSLEYDSVDLYRSVKKLNKVKFKKFMKDQLMDTKALLEKIAAGETDKLTKAQEKLLERRLSLADAALTDLTKAIFSDSDEVAIYELLDNNNENVQDAQFVIVGRKSLVLINRFWYL